MLNPKMQIVKTQLEACGVKVAAPSDSYIVMIDLSVSEAIFVENDEDMFKVSYETVGRTGFEAKAKDVTTTDDVYRAIRLALAKYEDHS